MRRRRRESLALLATLLPSCAQILIASPCLVSDGECFTLSPGEANANDWRLALNDESILLNAVQLPSQVQTLQLQGNKTRVELSGHWTGERLTSLLFIGLELRNTSLSTLPPSLTQLQIVDCVLDQMPLNWLLNLPQLKNFVWTLNTVMDKTLLDVNDKQLETLKALTGNSVKYEKLPSQEQEKQCKGSVHSLNDWFVCVVSEPPIRRLQLSSKMAEEGSKTEDEDSSTLVLLSLGLPFLYFLYKVGLAIFFIVTYKKTHGDNNHHQDNTKSEEVDTTNDSDTGRPTTNESSTSPPSSPSPRPHRRQEKKPLFTSNNADFWVEEDLQTWRLDFQRLELLKCLNLLPTEKRQTLRKQSVSSVMNPREIWLASYTGDQLPTAAVSGNTGILVVAKFLPLKEDQSTNGERDKLKGELKRQAMFSHPQICAFIGVMWSRETNLVALTEYMAQGDLRQWLHRTATRQAGKWSVLKVQILLDVTRALLYLHSMHPRLVHGNCNSRNVVLNTLLRAKLSDFGVDGWSEGLTERDLMSYSAVGSGRWISPEAIMGRDTSASYPDATDVYSFGILIAEMDSHELPFSDLMQANRSAVPETDILQLIARGALTPTLSPSCPKSIVKLVSACTSYKPKYRPSSTQVQQDLLRILEDFREFESQTTATISIGAPSSHRPSNLV